MMGDRGTCEVCFQSTIRQCTLCQRWVCMAHRGQCPCLLRYLTAGRDGHRLVHVFPPDLDIKAGLPCGGQLTGAINVRLDIAPEAGARWCTGCFAPDVATQADGWGTKTATVAVPTALYPDPKPTRRTGPRRAHHKPGAESTPDDYIEGETHKPTPGPVLLMDAAIGLPIAEARCTALAHDLISAASMIRAYEHQAETASAPKDQQHYRAQGALWTEHHAALQTKLAEWQAVHTAYLARLLASEGEIA